VSTKHRWADGGSPLKKDPAFTILQYSVQVSVPVQDQQSSARAAGQVQRLLWPLQLGRGPAGDVLYAMGHDVLSRFTLRQSRGRTTGTAAICGNSSILFRGGTLTVGLSLPVHYFTAPFTSHRWLEITRLASILPAGRPRKQLNRRSASERFLGGSR
jgi:hypothetical protein